MVKKLAVRFLGAVLFAVSVAVAGFTFGGVAQAADLHPDCPVCHATKLTCDGSLCTCHFGICYPPPPM